MMIKNYFLIFIFILILVKANGQYSFNSNFNNRLLLKEYPLGGLTPDFKIRTRTDGMVVGIQRGKYTFLELGAEVHWKKIRLIKPRTWGASGTFEYNFGNNVLGYKAGVWTKKGRINLTYGLTLCYFTDFDASRYGAGPAVGFRLLFLHLITGYNFTVGNKDFNKFNALYITLRAFFPSTTKIKLRKSNPN